MSETLEITVNGEPTTVDAGTTVSDLLERLGIAGRLAVELDGEIVPRSRHAEATLEPGARVEIVHAVGGG